MKLKFYFIILMIVIIRNLEIKELYNVTYIMKLLILLLDILDAYMSKKLYDYNRQKIYDKEVSRNSNWIS